jgi:hypothetical protein
MPGLRIAVRSDEILLRAIHAAESSFVALWGELFAVFRRAFPTRQVTSAARQQDWLTTERLIVDSLREDFTQPARAQLLPIVEEIMASTAMLLAPSVSHTLGSEITYQRYLPEVEHEAMLYTNTQVQQIMQATHIGIRHAVTLLPLAFIPIVIGLAPRQVRTLVHRQQQWEDAALQTREQRTQAQLFVAEALPQRTAVIAGTEATAAANMGQQQLWQQAERAGHFQPEEWVQVWVTTQDDRRCPRCRRMQGQQKAFGNMFFEPQTPNSVPYPPLHARCRCVVRMARQQEAVA